MSGIPMPAYEVLTPFPRIDGLNPPDLSLKVGEDGFIRGVGLVGRKDDTGKVRMELLMDMPRALKGVAEVLTWAVTKKQPVPYVAGSWQFVDDFYKRYSGALMRHQNNIATNGQFAVDHETQLLDLHHLATDALILAELTARELEKVKVG